MPAFTAAGVRLYVLSYDEPDALADFKSAHAVTFTMLSDPDSAVIRQFGILNSMIGEDDHPWYGVPYPGAYVIDSEGVVVAKFFENNFAVRSGPEQLLAAAQGREVILEGRSETTENVTVEVTLDGESLPAGLTREIVAVLRVPEGRHLYGEPVSGGLVAASIELDETPGILSYTPVFPDTRPLTLSGDGHTLQIYDGDVVLRLPVAQNGRTMNKDEDGRWVTVSGRVRWQACDQESCGLPEEQRFEIRVPAGYTLMADMGPGAGKVPAMNGAAHMKTMVSRRACGN